MIGLVKRQVFTPMSAGQLSVVHVDQEDDYSCVPACIKMVLDYLSAQLGIKIPNLTLDQIRKAVDTQVDGTALEDVPKINRKLAKASHRVEFIPSEGNSFGDIEKELEQGRPVIAWIKRLPEGRVLGHSIVITHVDRRNLTIRYDDPVYGQREQGIPAFMREWDNSANVLIRVRIESKPPQVELEEFLNAAQ